MKTQNKLTTEGFISKAKEIHKNKYDYSKTIYKDNRSKVCIICPEHGEFKLKPNEHLNGVGCPECAKEPTTEDFIKAARKIHGDKYDYSLVDYKKPFINVTIICPKHGEFKQRPSVHLSGRGCARCTEEKLKRSTYCPNEFITRDDVSVGEFKTMDDVLNFPLKEIWDINRTKSNKFKQYQSKGIRMYIICNWNKSIQDPTKFILKMQYKSGRVKYIDMNSTLIDFVE